MQEEDELSIPDEATARASRFRCPQCAADMAFDPGRGGLACDYCGASVEIACEDGGETVVEHDLERGLELARRGGYGEGVRRSRCGDCGATVCFGADVTSTRCDFCGSAQILAQEENRRALRPESLVPFQVPGSAARASFGGWLRGLWFRPSDLRHVARIEEIHGVYVPYWTFDASVASDWTAQSGTYYYVTVRGSDGKQRRERRTRWRPAWGSRSDSYDDVLVCASGGLPAELATRLETFDTRSLVPYEPGYLAGFKGEEYAIDLNEAWGRAVTIIEDTQRRRCARDVPGDTHRFLRVRNQLSDETFKHVLLPIWIAAYRYHDRIHRFLVNGQTGEVCGTAPWSVWKIAAAVLVVLIAVASGLYAWSEVR